MGEGEEKTLKCVYLFEDGLSVFKSHMGERNGTRDGEKDRK